MSPNEKETYPYGSSFKGREGATLKRGPSPAQNPLMLLVRTMYLRLSWVMSPILLNIANSLAWRALLGTAFHVGIRRMSPKSGGIYGGSVPQKGMHIPSPKRANLLNTDKDVRAGTNPP